MYEVIVSENARDFLRFLDSKSKRICKNNLKKLETPYPGRGTGDKEKLVVDGEEIYRLHIGRTYTAFYTIEEESKTVNVLDVVDIDDAHKRYGY